MEQTVKQTAAKAISEEKNQGHGEIRKKEEEIKIIKKIIFEEIAVLISDKG